MPRNLTAKARLAAATALACLLLAAPGAASRTDPPAPPNLPSCCEAPAFTLTGAPRPPAPPTSGDGSEPEAPAPEAETARQPPAQPPAEASSDAAADAGTFRGSAEPAGPDLSAGEERALISRGWE